MEEKEGVSPAHFYLPVFTFFSDTSRISFSLDDWHLNKMNISNRETSSFKKRNAAAFVKIDIALKLSCLSVADKLVTLFISFL